MEDLRGSDSSSDHQGDGPTQQQLSSLELENRLLKNEVASLNQEMSSLINRAKDSQDGKLCDPPLSHWPGKGIDQNGANWLHKYLILYIL